MHMLNFLDTFSMGITSDLLSFIVRIYLQCKDMWDIESRKNLETRRESAKVKQNFEFKCLNSYLQF